MGKIYKYKVPEIETRLYGNKKILYCKIKNSFNLYKNSKKEKICLVEILNLNNRLGIFSSKALKKINFFEKIGGKYESNRGNNDF